MAEGEDGIGLGRVLQAVVIGVVIFGCLHFTACESIYIASASMAPTLKVGLSAFLDKVTLRFRDPARGDIICLVAPSGEHEEVVKRVIAIGGDTIELRAKTVVLNGKEIAEPYVRHTREKETLTGDNLAQMTVPPGHVFVLGDNRDESNDSSMWKDKSGQPDPFVPLSKVKGIVRGFY
ncbi:MAG: signal peptidase I [Elusimicrobia bacterium]|nr:signal peptidase I [Elusimicrobiota bacterium]